MIWTAIGSVLPTAAAVALSPIPIVAVVLVLGAPRARVAGPAFAVGWVAGLSAVVLAVGLIIGAANDGGEPTRGVEALRLVLGVVVLVIGIRKLRGRPASGGEPELPGWMVALGSVAPGRALGLGVVMSGANPKNVVLAATAAASITSTGLDGADAFLAGATFVVLGSVTVVGAVVASRYGGARAAKGLASVEQFMLDNNAVITGVILVLLGAKLAGDGMAGLAAAG